MYLKSGSELQCGKYRIIENIGQGGFGITYLAEQILAKRKVCIKEFFPQCYCSRREGSDDTCLTSARFAVPMDRFKSKFVKEAQTIADIKHNNIISVHDVFEQNNTAYYAMEYIEGESLSGLVQRKGALKEEDAIVYIKQVADALCYLHSRRIMHLDIKPSNIMLRHSDNQAILIDFGLSKHYSTYSGEATSTTPIGFSYGFAPMEQYKQGGVSEFSPETDIYSLGATLYYLVVGAVPPDAAAIAEDGLPKLPSKLSEGVRVAIEKSMSVNRKNRPHSINEFLELLNKHDDEDQSDESKRAILIALLIIIGVVVLIILIVKFWEYLLAILLLPLVLPALLKMK